VRGHAVPREGAKYANGRDPRNPYTVDEKIDYGRLRSPARVEPACLIRLALPGRAGRLRPSPEEPEPEPGPGAEATDGLAIGLSGIDERRKQRPVLFPVREEDGTFEARAADEDVPGRGRLDCGGEDKCHCSGPDKSERSNHTRITPERSSGSVRLDDLASL